MQNFSNSPAPPTIPPGFSGRSVGGSPYPPQSVEPQISPRMTEDYVGMQQQSIHRGPQHPSQASHLLAYGARNRGALEPPPTQGNVHTGNNNNPYRKEVMDYYFSMGGKDRHRRGGMGYGGGFGYSSIDGHIPHQYRHPGSGSATSSGLMSPYPVDYGSTAGSVATAGAFSPSHQYNMNQNPVMQTVPGSQMQQRQHGQSFPPVHHTQQQRTYQHSGHRMTPQYPHYSPQGGASTGSSGMYSPPLQRYLDGAANASFDPKVNSSPNVNASSNSIAANNNNVGPLETVQQSYPASNYSGYLPKSHSLHKQVTLQHRNLQHSLGVGYDGSLKMPHQGPSSGAVYAKHHQASNPSIAQPSSQEIAKSPMHSNAQQTQMNQNFSPISNPSPAASAVHSPSCSSSPSPLMGVSEALGNASNQVPPMSSTRSSHGHGRLLHAAPQLSPTPNSNSSISSCGSSGSQKAHSLSAVGGSSLPPVGRTKMSQGSREEGSSVYSTSSVDRMQDAGLNSLNALSSQVANLPNTVQHMLLTDTVFSHKKRDGGQTPQTAHCVPPTQPRSRNLSAASSSSTVKDIRTGDGAEEDSSLMPIGAPLGTKVEREEQLSEGEHGRVRQVSGASTGSEATGYNPTQTQTGQACNVKRVVLDTHSKEASVTETKTKETNIPSSAASLSSEGGLTLHSAPPVSSSPSSSILPATAQNCVPETGLAYNDHRGREIKKENEAAAEKTQKVSSQMQQDGGVSAKNGQEKEGMFHSESHSKKKKEKQASEEQQNVSSVGVIVSSHTDKSRHPQDNCVEEKMSLSYLKEASSHNGEEGVDLSLYSSHHQKSNSGRSQNPPQPASHKYSYSESTYGSDMSMKNRARASSASVMETNPRYIGYQHSQTGYGAVHPKDGSGSVAETLMKKGHGSGSKAQEENSQMQQFPSLLQEVLQGYNLDRRYGRPEQTFPARHQAPQQFPTRHSLGMTEGTPIHSGVPEASSYSAQIGKPTNQKHGSDPDFTDTQSLVKSEVSNPKSLQNAEKPNMGHLTQTADSQQPPAKHINLSDYSMPQRKTLSNVQELLLQEPEMLTLTSKTEPQKSAGSVVAKSERRTVICDVSPNRRGTPEREGEREREREKSQSGASVIQQSFSSPEAPSDLSKKDVGEKQVVKMETVSKEAGNSQTENHGSESEVEYHSKTSHLSSGVSADPYRRGTVDISPMPSHPVSMTALSSPTRHHSYLHGVDLSSGSSGTFPGYRYGDSREDNVMSRSNLHFPSHHPFHHLASQSTSKLQMYPHPRGPPHPSQDMSEWLKAINRPPKEMMMQQGTSPGRHKVNQSEQRQRLIPPADMQVEHTNKSQSVHHQNPYYDIKMWESTNPGREGARLMEGDSYYRAQPPPPLPASTPVASQSHTVTQMTHGHNAVKLEASKGATEEAKHPCPPPPPISSKPSTETNTTQVQRPTKAGGSGDTNPLILRRRVRSFISPIPAKRLHQDTPQQRAATNSHHSPGARSEPSHHNDDDSSNPEMPCPRLSSPQPGENTFIQPLSPSGGNTKVLAARKGRGLKLEAIVQKITPNIKRPTGPTDDESNHYPGFLHSEIPIFNESQDQDLAHFPRVAGGEDSYMDESHSLNNMIPFRGVDESGPLPSSSFPCDSHQTSQVKQQDFDFGLGTSVVSASGDKEDFALLGPLPPPPPLPRPVQGSPPPSSSALSDIQHFTNTYQQLETRRGEQSAANLLRQKLQESGMGFEDYPNSEYYGTTLPHQGHMLNRQHQMSSGRSSLSPTDSKPLENVVPKGYFPSGKKKGRPVGSVNKQKRAQIQVPVQVQAQAQPQSTALSDPPAPTTPTPSTPAPASTPPATQPPSSTSTPPAPTLSENANTPPIAPPVLTQVVKADVESEDTQLEIEVKQVRRRRRGAKVDNEPLEARGRQRRRRRAPVATAPPVSKDEPDPPLGAGGSFGSNRGFTDPNRKGLFIPHIHVEKKIPEIGAVCTIVNAEDDKMKGERSAAGGKAGGGGIDSLLPSALSSQLSRRDRESEKREMDEVETTLQSGKALPSSGYVVTGPVITETNHSGRLLCCLCQKWANYKHLGDLYGPYYPAEYAAKLPKNQPQIRQCQATTGPNKTGPNLDTNTLSTLQVTQTRLAQFNKPSSENNNCSSNPGDRSASTAVTEEMMMMMHMPGKLSNTLTPVKTPLTWDKNSDIRPIPELKKEPDLESDQQQAQKQPQQLTDDTQQRPQHRKLTSHPRFKRRHKSSEDSPRMVPSNSKASLPFQPPPPALDSLGPLAQLAQLPQMPMDPEELWVHEGCIVWTSGVYLVNGRLYGLQEALDGARETSCSFCEMVGSTLGCYSKGCTLRYHYLCAIEADCSLNEDNFSLRCPKHKVKKESLPRASGQPSQCLWSSQREAEGNWEKEEQDLGSWYLGE